MSDNSENPLKISNESGELVIRIGINRLDGNEYHPTIPCLKFDNREEWIKDVIAEIQREEEDGSSPISNLLDKAMENALEQGSMGVAEDSFTFIGQCPVCEEDCSPLRHTKDGIRCPKCVEVKP